MFKNVKKGTKKAKVVLTKEEKKMKAKKILKVVGKVVFGVVVTAGAVLAVIIFGKDKKPTEAVEIAKDAVEIVVDAVADVAEEAVNTVTE